MKQMKQFDKDKIATIIPVLLNLVYGVLLVYLHYNQTLYVDKDCVKPVETKAEKTTTEKQPVYKGME